MRIAIFSFPSHDESQFKVVPGDELRLRLDAHAARLNGSDWDGVGHVLWMHESDIALEMRERKGKDVLRSRMRSGANKLAPRFKVGPSVIKVDPHR